MKLPIPLPRISFHEIVFHPLEPIEWIVEPVLARTERAVFYGEFGSFKSWILLDLGIALASGMPWLNVFPTVKQRVLYIDEEMGVRLLHRRVKRLADGRHLTTSIPFDTLSHAGVRFTDGGADMLLHAMKLSLMDPEVVIVETLRRVMVGNENEAEAVSNFWRAVDPLIRSGKTLIISHHMRKPKEVDSTRYRASGSTDIIAGSDTSYSITKLDPAAAEIKCEKARETEELEPFRVQILDDDGDGPIVLRGIVGTTDAELQTLCRQHPNETHHTLTRIAMERFGISRATYYRRLHNLTCIHKERS